MGTRSRIGYVDPKTNMIHSIYCHWDGYLSNNGRLLRDHYKDLKKVKRLIALGDISSLEKHVSWRTAPKPFVNRNWRDHEAYANTPQFVEKHTGETPVKDVTVAYHRDNGEAWERVKPHVDGIMLDRQEYNYLYRSGHWFYRTYDMKDWAPIPKTEVA